MQSCDYDLLNGGPMMMDHVMLYLQLMNIIDIELHLETRPMLLFVCWAPLWGTYLLALLSLCQNDLAIGKNQKSTSDMT